MRKPFRDANTALRQSGFRPRPFGRTIDDHVFAGEAIAEKLKVLKAAARPGTASGSATASGTGTASDTGAGE